MRSRAALFSALCSTIPRYQLQPVTLSNPPLTYLLGSSDIAIAIIFGVLGTIINIFGILIAYLTLRAMNVENHIPQPSRMFTKHQLSELKGSDKLIVAEEPRPQQLLYVHKHTHTFNHTDAEDDIVRRGQ